jgi:phosphoribosylformimino-5-aminoimidazole carboxamide ribotide isomerase
MKIMPAIDIIGGKCVRLLKGDYAEQTNYEKSPVEMARYFESCGADRIHVVDLDGARQKKLVNVESVAEICRAVSIPVEFGGGIRTQDDIDALFKLGVSEVIFGSLAVKNPTLLTKFLEVFGSDRIIIAIDALNGVPKVSGWQEGSNLSVKELIDRMESIGVKTINYTDISRDGTLSSPNFEVYQQLLKKYPDLNFVASGGVSSKEDVEKLEKIGVYGVIIGKVLYEGTLNLLEIC